MMIPHRLFRAFACVVLFASVASAESKQKTGEKLITRAAELSDIRATGAPAFRIKASFRTPSDHGTYTEVWVSREQWRRETEMGDFHRIETGGHKSRWLLDNKEDMPPEAATVMKSILDLHLLPEHLKVDSIVDKEVEGIAERCVNSETEFSRNEYCVDAKDNTLLSQETITSRSRSSRVYRDYERLGEHLFPRSIRVTEDGQTLVEIAISELAPAPSAEPAQFVAPSGAVEITNCQAADLTPPQARSAPDPMFPKNQNTKHAVVVLWLVVKEDGKPYDIRVTRSEGMAFDQEALRTVGLWRFMPAQCSGELVPMEINVEVTFSR
jgi:TonB family protein